MESKTGRFEALILTWMLRLVGGMLVCALIPMLFPLSWMSSINDLLGLSSFHTSPLVSYLTRSVSALYAMHGALAILLSTDLKRYQPIIVGYFGFDAIFGLIVTAIDWEAGLPWYWTLCEGPPVFVFSLIGVLLARRISLV